MSLLLCRQEYVEHPFYVECLGVRLYSSQELAYVIYQHPLLVMDDFVEEGLLGFLRDECGLGFLALKLERWMKSHEDPDEALAMILQESDYYSSQEISRFRQKVAGFRKKHPAEYKKLRADELFSLGQYGRASRQYQELLSYPRDGVVDDGFLAKVWNNLGSCYARMFRTEQAYECYRQAYTLHGDPQVLRQLYCLSKLDGRLSFGDRFKALVTEELQAQWDGAMDEARKKASGADQVGQVETLFAKDPIRRQAGAEELQHKWKKEYRTMV